MISEYRKLVYRLCSLDIVNAVANMPYLDPDEVRSMEFTLNSMLARQQEMNKREDEADLVSEISEEDSQELSSSTESLKTDSDSDDETKYPSSKLISTIN